MGLQSRARLSELFLAALVFVAAHRLSLVAESRDYSLVVVGEPSHCSGFSCCREQAPGVRVSVAATPRLSSCGAQAAVTALRL